MAFNTNDKERKALEEQLEGGAKKRSKNKNNMPLSIPVNDAKQPEKTNQYTMTLKPSVHKKLEKLATSQGFTRGGRANVSAFLAAFINSSYDKLFNQENN